MNQARTGRYCAADFEEPKGPGWLIAGVIVWSLIAMGGSFYCGMVFQKKLDDGAAKLAALKPRLIPVPATALTQWSCSRQETREREFACAHRLWTENAIKPPKR